MAGAPGFLQIDGKEYVVIPKAEYERLTGTASEGVLKDAGQTMREMLARDLRKARETAGLTQEQLAEKLGVGQPMVSAAESGKSKVGERYVKRVLKACKLPADWVPPKEVGLVEKFEELGRAVVVEMHRGATIGGVSEESRPMATEFTHFARLPQSHGLDEEAFKQLGGRSAPPLTRTRERLSKVAARRKAAATGRA
jgi:transcriptional regulator with XRE-family HTH domain